MIFFSQSSQPNEIIQEKKNRRKEYIYGKRFYPLGWEAPPPPSCLATLTMDEDSDTLQEPRQY